MTEQVLEDLAKFQVNGSGWTFHSIVALAIHTVEHEPLNGSSWVPLPKFLASKDIDKFERLNPEIKVNVFGYEAGCVYPPRISKLKREKNVRLLLLENKHYCLVKNFSRLVSMQVSKHHSAVEVCVLRCLNHFPNKKVLEKHEGNCQNHKAIKIVFPKKGTILEFKNHKRSMRVPIVVYVDFESFTKSIDSC